MKLIHSTCNISNCRYYVSSVENKPSQQQVYVVNVDTLSDKCITCDFQTPEGFCKYSSASFSKDFTYYAKICNGPGPNFITIDSSTSYVVSILINFANAITNLHYYIIEGRRNGLGK